LTDHDDKILLIFEYLKQFEESKIRELDQQNRPKIEFKQDSKGKSRSSKRNSAKYGAGI
jgi:hypothetical protein